MKQIAYRAPAKVILSGEHSVVYTKPAFVTAVQLYLTATLTASQTSISQQKSDPFEFCDKTIRAFVQKEGALAQKIKPYLSITSTIPQGRGMGSSAAYCVAVCAALLEWYTGKQPSIEVVNNNAFQCEKYFHGIPSGVDVSASSYGGLIFYRKEFEFLKTISALNFKLPKPIEERLILIDSGKPKESTKEMVSHVGKRYNQYPQKMDRVLSSIEKVTKRMVVSIVKEDAAFFGDCIKENQKLLEGLGIVSRRTKRLLSVLESFGMGKVTGAGGVKTDSGLLLFFAKDTARLIDFLNEKQIEHYPFKQAFAGVEKVDK